MVATSRAVDQLGRCVCEVGIRWLRRVEGLLWLFDVDEDIAFESGQPCGRTCIDLRDGLPGERDILQSKLIASAPPCRLGGTLSDAGQLVAGRQQPDQRLVVRDRLGRGSQ